MKIDEFLTLPSLGLELLATVEESEADQSKVLVTPWEEDGGCACDAALVLPKSAIEQIESTDKRHLCCGKVLRVARVTLKTDASLAAADVLPALMRKSRTASTPMFADDCFQTCSEEAADCLANCGGPGCKMGCNRRFKACLKECRSAA
jgi:hypothetical protein